MNQLTLLGPKRTPAIYVYSEPMSMCSGFPRLTEIVEKKWSVEKLLQNDLYLFVNKKQTYCKILFWSKGGVCILAKKLEKGKFLFDLEKHTIEISELNKALDVH